MAKSIKSAKAFVTQYNGAHKQVTLFDADDLLWVCPVNGRQLLGRVIKQIDGIACYVTPVADVDVWKGSTFEPL